MHNLTAMRSSHIILHMRACIAQAVVGIEYTVMYYKRTNMIGIRSKAGKKPQVFSFGGKRCGRDEATLRAVADQVLEKLNAHEDVLVVKAWAIAEVACDLH